MKIKVLPKQSFLDIAIEHTGSVYNAFSIAVSNDMAVSDYLITGSELVIPDSLVKDNYVLHYYRLRNIHPATALSEKTAIEEHRGIGWMKIESTFKVS